MNSLTVAALQTVSSTHLLSNLKAASDLILKAAASGAHLVLLPEYFCLLGSSPNDKLKIAERDGEGPIQDFLKEQALRHKIVVVGGSVPLQSLEPNKIWNSCLAYDAQGQRIARYDKIHLFAYHDDQQSFDEAQTIIAGSQPVVLHADINGSSWRIGFSICYDLRFPELYRQLSKLGEPPCDLFLVPSAFTHITGQAHWEVLLRARAIENQCYVLAAAQGGLHQNGRRTWGHSLLVNAWGEVVAVQEHDGPGVVLGHIDRQQLQSARQRLPALQHRIPTSFP
jgi:deaminated glutathione amidase